MLHRSHSTHLALEFDEIDSTLGVTGGDMASTRVAKPSGACRGAEDLVKPSANNLVANDDNYALAA